MRIANNCYQYVAYIKNRSVIDQISYAFMDKFIFYFGQLARTVLTRSSLLR